MEKEYILLYIGKTATSGNSEAEVVYVFDTPFRHKLYETAVKEKKTDLKDENTFNESIEIYKLLKQNEYFGYDTLKITSFSGVKTEFTKEEAKMVVKIMENKVIDIKNALKDIKKILEEEKKEKRVVVYTCITGGYDNLIEPSVVTPGIDYVCFTDNMSMKSETWKMRPIPEELKQYSKVKQQRGIKILAHRYLSDYDISIWIDGAVKVQGNINDYLKDLDLSTFKVFIPEHPSRKCIYTEKEACVRIKKIKGDEITLADKQMKRYKDEGFPDNYGLVQSNIMVRVHNDKYSKDLMEKWWSELKDYSHRDQLSFNYALWKIGNEKFKYLIKTTCNSKTFNWIKVHNKK